MKAFEQFQREDKSFWFFIRFISEKLGYSNRGANLVRSYSSKEIEHLCRKENISFTPDQLSQAVKYCEMRASLLNDIVEPNLMDVETARPIFESMYSPDKYTFTLPMNKQSGKKKRVNYFAAIITMLAEDVLGSNRAFDPNPHGLVYMLSNQRIVGASSRRFDGAFPSVYTPKMVWEIKEYYYTKTFGSRIADGVYETLLDGYEFNEIENRTGTHVKHVMLIDSHYTFWVKGKSYLCRFVDALNMGLIDELIIGKEVLTRWPEILRECRQS